MKRAERHVSGIRAARIEVSVGAVDGGCSEDWGGTSELAVSDGAEIGMGT